MISVMHGINSTHSTMPFPRIQRAIDNWDRLQKSVWLKFNIRKSRYQGFKTPVWTEWVGNFPNYGTLLNFNPEPFSTWCRIDAEFHYNWISFLSVRLQTGFQSIYSDNVTKRHNYSHNYTTNTWDINTVIFSFLHAFSCLATRSSSLARAVSFHSLCGIWIWGGERME